MMNSKAPFLYKLSKVILGFIFKECLSITENLVKLDVWIPDSIKRLLDAGIEKVDKKDGE